VNRIDAVFKSLAAAGRKAFMPFISAGDPSLPVTAAILRTLQDRALIRIVGRADVLGRPFLYGTTKRFLEAFGLKSLDDQPSVEELHIP
jgi:hypothetical protein